MIEFVAATQSDAQTISKLRQKVWSTTYRGIFPDEMIDQFDYSWHEERDLARIRSGDYMVCCITASGESIGYVIVGTKEPLVLQSLYILPEYQRHGIGRMVFAWIRNYCKNNGIAAFICHCHPENKNALAFYQKMGGRIIARDENGDAHWQDTVVLEFTVSGHQMKKTDQYDDIIHLPHHVSRRHARMSRLDRAAQFSPFAALTGFDATIAETGRLTDRSIELDESRKEMLNQHLRYLLSVIGQQPGVRVTYFREDERKAGGAYVTVTGRVKKVDAYEHAIVLMDGTVIPMELVRDIEVDT